MGDILLSARQHFFSGRQWRYSQAHGRNSNPNGFSNNNVDCTYLVYLSNLRAGYSVPYMATSELISNGQLTSNASKYYELVDAANVRPGDIVYFSKGGIVPNNHTMLVTSSSVDSNGNISGTAYGAQSERTGVKDNVAFGRNANPGETQYYNVQPQLFLRVKQSQYVTELDMTGSAGTGLASPKVTALVNLLKTPGVEDFRPGIYPDDRGYPTVGNGFNLLPAGKLRDEGEIKGLLRLAGLPESKYDELPLDKLKLAESLLQQGRMVEAKALFVNGKNPSAGDFSLSPAQADKLTAAFVVAEVVPKMISGLGVTDRDLGNFNALTTGEFVALGTKLYQWPNWLSTAKGEQFFEEWVNDNKTAAVALLTEKQPDLKSRLMAEAYEGSVNTSNVNLTGSATAAAGSNALPQSNTDPLAVDPVTQAALDSAFFGTVPGAPADSVFVPIRATGTPVQPPSNPTADYVNSHIIPGRDGSTLLFPGGTSITLGAGEAYQLSSDLKSVTIARPAEGGVYIKTVYNTQLRSVGGEVVIGEGTPGRIAIKVNDPLAVNIDRVEGGIVVDAGNTIYTSNSSTEAAVLIVNSRDAQGNAITSVKTRSNAQEALAEVAGAQGAAVLSNGTVKIYTEQGVRTFDQGTLSAAEPVPTHNPQGADSLNEFINKDRTPEPTPTNTPNPSDTTEELSSSLGPWLSDLADQLDEGNVSLYASSGAADSGRVFGFEDDFVYRGKDANGFIRLETLGGDGQTGLPPGLSVLYDPQTRQFILPAKDDIGPMLVNLNAGASVALFNGQDKPAGWGFNATTNKQLEDQPWDTVSSGSNTIETVSAAIAGSWVSFSVDEAADTLIAIRSINGSSISATTNGIDPQDLAAWGFRFEGIDTNNPFVTSLIEGLDPTELSSTGWPTPTVLETVLPSGLISRSIELPGLTLTNLRNSSGELLSTISQTDLGFNETAIRIYSPEGDLLQVGKRTADIVTGGYTETLRNEITGQIIINSASGPNVGSGGGGSSDAADSGGNGGVITSVPISGTGYGGSTGASIWTSTLSAAARAANDFLGFASAIQSGRPLSILSSGLRVGTYIDPGNTALNTASSIAGGVSSLLNLGNALERGDTVGSIYAGSQLYGSGLSLYAQSTTIGLSAFDIDAITEVGDAFAAADSFNGGVLPYVGIFNSLAHGDPVGAAVSYIAITYPVIGWIYGALQILSSLFSDPPEPWGQGSLVWASQEVIDGYIEQVGYSGSGDNIGEAYSVSVPNSKTVIDLSTTNLVIKYAAGDGGDATISNVLSGFKANAEALLAQTQERTATPLGLIAERLPSARYHVYEGFTLYDFDAVLGKDNTRRYDTQGRNTSDPAGSPEFYRSMGEQFVYSAVERQAIAPMWEVKTAQLQAFNHDPEAGLTEEVRAQRAGKAAQISQGGAGEPSSQVFRPIVLDLNGDGRIPNIGYTNSQVLFDVDYSRADSDAGALHFLKRTDWISADDGFLVLDKNFNGQIDGGSELFSNARVDESLRGLASLRVVDANGDGLITADDPVYASLQVWQDANGNGRVDAGELTSLQQRGITRLDWSAQSYTAGGQARSMQGLALQADTLGAVEHPVSNGIVVLSSNGATVLKISKVDDVPSISAGSDHVSTAEDLPIEIHSSLLLANDRLTNGFGEPLTGVLTLASVQSAQHGSVSFNAATGIIRFVPDANYDGENHTGEGAGFTYTVRDASGKTAQAYVGVGTAPVNDAPVIDSQVQEYSRLYGYQGVTGGRFDPDADWAQPTYQPYSGADYSQYFNNGSVLMGLHDQPINNTLYDLDGPWKGRVRASDIDDTVLSFSVLQDAQFGHGTINASGQWEYVPSGYTNSANDAFVVKVTDAHGGSSTISVVVVANNPPEGNGEYIPNIDSRDPIILDLDNNGIHLSRAEDSHVFFDLNDDGWRNRTAWVTDGDGFLGFDRNDDGLISGTKEISFTSYKPGAQTDLEGLAFFDSNGDGKLSAADRYWGKFKLWVDANHDGVSQAGEVQSLDAAGLQSLNLTNNRQFSQISGNTIHGYTTAVRADGSSISVADASLSYTNEVLQTKPDGSTAVATRRTHGDGTKNLNGTETGEILVGYLGDSVIDAKGGDDFVYDDDGNDFIRGGSGNDTIYSDEGHDVILADEGNDVVFGGLGGDYVDAGAGNDIVFGEAGDDMLMGRAGDDTLDGGAGQDILVGDIGDDTLSGGTGRDILFGDEGNDQLFGGEQNDLLNGGAGADLLSGGEGADIMQGGAGDDTYEVDDALDLVDETVGGQINAEGQLVWGTGDAGGTDTVRSSITFDLSAGHNTLVENLSLTGEAAINGTGNAGANLLVGNAAANTLRGLEGNDTLDGGLGADTLVGGSGDDVYVIDNAGDSVMELAGEGTDVVRSRISTTLVENVENLALIGINAINGTGNAQANDIRGNAAANILTGGHGNDSLAGGGGNDSYVFARGDGQDTITDTQGQNRLIFGTDIAASDLRYSLAGNNLVVSITQGGQSTDDQITLSNWYLPANQRMGAQRVNSVQFADGSILALDESALNHAPVLLADTASLTEDAVAIAGNVLANDSDEDEALTGRTLRVTNADTYVGQYGTLSLAADGSYRYALRSGDADIQGLRQGQSLSERFAYSVTDDAAIETGNASSSLTITITGSNDAPILQADVNSAALQEDGLLVASGNVLSNDRDVDVGDMLTVANAGTYQGTYGQLILQANGAYSYTLNNASSAVQQLSAGQLVQESFSITVTDGMAPASSSLSFSISGSYDALQVQADVATLVEDQVLVATGNVLANDSSPNSGSQLSVANAGIYQGAYGSLELQADGNYSYVLNNSSNAVQTLRAGQLVADVFTLQTTDGIATEASSLTLNITGSNDAPIVQADVAAASEDGIVTAAGNVLTNDRDIDIGDVFSISNAGTYQGTYGSLVLQTNGSYSYALNNSSSAVQSLAQGQQVQDVFDVQITDGVASASSALALNITGANDGPVVQTDSASVTEDGITTASGNVLANDSDVDFGDVLSVANAGIYQGSYGSLTLLANGNYSYVLDNSASAVQSLSAGQFVSDVFTLKTTDGIATMASSLTLTIEGSYDQLIIQADIAAATEDDPATAWVTGNVLSNDNNPNVGATLAVANAGVYQSALGELTLLADGSYSYRLSNASAQVQQLSVGQQVEDRFVVSVTDGNTTVASSLTLNITGSNDGPIVQADSASLSEDGIMTATGNMLANDSDIDSGDLLSIANAGTYQGTYGSLVLQTNGSYTYTLANSSSAVQSLHQGQQVSDAFTLQTTDGISTMASSLTLNITGTNDIPVLASMISAQSATEIVAFELDLPVGLFTDADAHETLIYSATLANGSPLPSWLSFNAATQRFSGEPAFEDIGLLAISVTATDSQGASATVNFNLTANQSPELTVIGTAGNDNLRGASRNDLLDGGAGADVMRGGRGDDRYVVDNTADLVTEFFNQGNDSITSSVNYVTPAHLENLFLTGNAITATGNELNNVLLGNAGNNTLMGGSGQDWLAGWLGNDSLDGGQDGDVYQWNQGDGRDSITESSANTGTDILRFGSGVTLESLVSREFTDSAGNRRLFISVLDADGQERPDQGVELALSSTGSSVIERFELTGTNGTFSTFTLNQIKVSTVNTYGGNGNDALTGSRADDQIAGGNGDDTLYGRSGNDVLWGDNGNDKLFGEGGNDKLWGGNGDDWLQGGAGNDEMGGDNGKDTLLGGSGDDKLYGGNDADILDAGTGADLLIGDNGEDQLFAGDGNDTLYGGNDSDVLAAGAGDDIIDGDNGTDIIIAGAGADSITSGNDADFVDAGSGNDSIDTGNGADFIAGGKGNDTINAGQDSDVIAFNRGDGQDKFITQEWQSDTVSLGGGIRYADLSLAKSGNDLILRTGGDDQISFKDWYVGSNKQRNNVSRLQLITAATGGDYNAASSDKLLNKQAVQLDFAKLVSAFDAARASSSQAASGWAVSSASLNTAYVSGSNTQALGGDLAWRYATLNPANGASGLGQEASYGNLDAAGVRTAMSGLGSLRNWTSTMPAPVSPWIALQAGISLIVEQPTGANPTLTPIIPLTQDQLIMQGLGAQAQMTGQAKPGWA